MGDHGSSLATLVERSQAGESDSLDMLSRQVRERLYPYARRVLLDHVEAEDVVQDVLITILQSISTLKQPDRFWSWVFTIATNRIRERRRREARHRILSIAQVGDAQMQPVWGTDQAGLDHAQRLCRQELAERTQEAMRRLPQRQRMVLSLRVYENMPHREIAAVIGSTELGARVLFFQAKRALVSRLHRMGIDKAALGLALVAFGRLTLAPGAAEASVVVSSTAIAEGLLAGLAAAKAKLLVVLLVLLAGAGSLSWFIRPDAPKAWRPPPGPFGMHFVHQSLVPGSEPLNFRSSMSQGAYEQWFQFPEGVDGPCFFRMQRWDPAQKEKLCWWVENEEGNFYVHSGEGVIYRSNAHLTTGNLRTRVLPSDPQEFCAFAQQMDMDFISPLVDGPGLAHERDPSTGQLLRRIDRRFPPLGTFETAYEYGIQPPDLFRSPSGLPVRDERDIMHKRGWTLFTVSGEFRGRPVSGSGRIPFTAAAAREHPAFIQVAVEDRSVAVDDGRRARLTLDRRSEDYAGGRLFRGLGRPWMGFHAIDTVRRDAATEGVWYLTQVIAAESAAEVELRAARGSTRYLVRYRVALESDLVESIRFWIDPGVGEEKEAGTLVFKYAQQLDSLSVAVPSLAGRGRPDPDDTPGVLWLCRLAEATPPADSN